MREFRHGGQSASDGAARGHDAQVVLQSLPAGAAEASFTNPAFHYADPGANGSETLTNSRSSTQALGRCTRAKPRSPSQVHLKISTRTEVTVARAAGVAMTTAAGVSARRCRALSLQQAISVSRQLVPWTGQGVAGNISGPRSLAWVKGWRKWPLLMSVRDAGADSCRP